MKKINFSLIVLAALLASPNVYGQDQIAAPSYRNGDFWIFRVGEKDFLTQTTRALDGDYRVAFSDGKFAVRSIAESNGKTNQSVGVLKRMLYIPDEEDQLLQFPLAVGKKWDTSHEAEGRRGGGRVAHMKGETNVTGIEEIKTSAGTFRALKIERSDRGRASGGKKAEFHDNTYTFYYSPETRSIVKYKYEQREASGVGSRAGIREIELVKFGSRR